MKKLVVAIFAILAFAACNKELEPEYTTPPVFSNVKLVNTPVTAADKGRFTATVASQYGLQTVMILYYLDDKNSNLDIKSEKMLFNIAPNATTQNVEGQIPVQKVGTKVTYQLVAYSYYMVQGGSAVGTYTVEDTIVPLPEPEE